MYFQMYQSKYILGVSIAHERSAQEAARKRAAFSGMPPKRG